MDLFDKNVIIWLLVEEDKNEWIEMTEIYLWWKTTQKPQ